MLQFLNKINSIVWGLPTLLLIFLTGIIISYRSKFLQIRFFGRALKVFFKTSTSKSGKNLTPLQSASTALSATMGTGNIIGVAGAVALGGPGAVFWMWVSAVLCMVIKFSEIILSVHFKEKNVDGSFSGGAMYYIKKALPKFFSPLATLFCVFGIAASFGIGNMAQINTIASSVNLFAKSVISVSPYNEYFIKLSAGVVCALLCAVILKNDISIGRFCEKIMPLMALLYICMTVIAILINYRNIPAAFSQIFIGAFKPKSVTAGAIGSVFTCLRFGIARGIFSNEAGLGTAPIAYACSDGNEVQLGLMGIVEVFIDTIVVCTLTALTILCAGKITYGVDTASLLTFNALESVYGRYVIFLFCPIICFFAFSSVIGWGLYGTKFASFLWGKKSKKVFLLFFILVMLPASVFRADAIWILAEIFNGLMCLPNITALLLLIDEVLGITKKQEPVPR